MQFTKYVQQVTKSMHQVAKNPCGIGDMSDMELETSCAQTRPVLQIHSIRWAPRAKAWRVLLATHPAAALNPWQRLPWIPTLQKSCVVVGAAVGMVSWWMHMYPSLSPALYDVSPFNSSTLKDGGWRVRGSGRSMYISLQLQPSARGHLSIPSKL